LSELTKVQFNNENSYKMTKKREIFVIAIAVLLAHGCSESHGQGLEAKVAGAKLPTPLYRHSAVYDGNDSVYIFGG
jgi:hypothetical protein